MLIWIPSRKSKSLFYLSQHDADELADEYCMGVFHRAGVPQVALPMWMDCYDYGNLVEYIGVGVWPSRHTAPEWNVEDLSAAILKVIDGGEEGAAIRAKAKTVGGEAPKGRNVAADIVAKLASTVV